MEYNKPYLTDTRLVAGELSQHYENIFASINPVFIGSEETVFNYGYGSYLLYIRTVKIIKRLKKSSIDKWRDRTLLQQGQETYYKYIETPSKTRFIQSALKIFQSLKDLPYKRLNYALNCINHYIKIKKSISMQIILYNIQLKILNQKFEVFCEIKKLAYLKKVQNRFIKERILWSSLCIKNSRNYCVKVALKKWKKWITEKMRKLKVDIHCKITRFKNYERIAITKLIKAFFDSQSKKKCLSFFKWRENAKTLAKTLKKLKIDQEASHRLKLKNDEISEFELNLAEHKTQQIENQVESLLYGFSIDTLNGFLNL